MNTDAPIKEKLLQRIQERIFSEIGSGSIEEASLNPLSKNMPTLIVHPTAYFEVVQLLKMTPELAFHFLVDLHGTDFGRHMEVYLQLHSLKLEADVVIKVRLSPPQFELDSLVALWPGASGLEAETYDLLGIHFLGHLNLRRIFLGEDWIGYPLRKDYQVLGKKEVVQR